MQLGHMKKISIKKQLDCLRME